MTGDCHVRFSERPGAKLPRATHLVPHAGICAGGGSSPQGEDPSLPRPRDLFMLRTGRSHDHPPVVMEGRVVRGRPRP